MARMYKDVDVEVEIGLSDVLDYITDYASDDEIQQICKVIGPFQVSDLTELDSSYIQEEKMILLNRAMSKYTLEELEKKLGNKWDLI